MKVRDFIITLSGLDPESEVQIVEPEEKDGVYTVSSIIGELAYHDYSYEDEVDLKAQRPPHAYIIVDSYEHF